MVSKTLEKITGTSTKIHYKEIDVLKGVGILLVILGHLKVPHDLSKFIFSFHMPLFFFISGFVFKSKDYWPFTVDKFKRIMIPYYVFSALSFFLYYVSNTGNSNLTVKDFILGTLLGISNDFYLAWNVVLWFLPSLFFINVLVNSLYAISKVFLYVFASGLFFVALVLVGNQDTTFLFFHIGSALLMLPFFIAGFLVKENYNVFNQKIASMNNIVPFVITAFLFLTGVTISFLNDRTPDVRIHIVGTPLFFYCGAMLIILGLVFFFHLIFSLFGSLQLRVLAWLGVNSLLIMCIHLKLRATSVKIMDRIPIDDHYRVCQALLIIILCIPLVFIFNKYLPMAIGVKK